MQGGYVCLFALTKLGREVTTCARADCLIRYAETFTEYAVDTYTAVPAEHENENENDNETEPRIENTIKQNRFTATIKRAF